MSKTPVPDPDQTPVVPEPVPEPYPCAMYHPTDASSPRLVVDAATAERLEAEGWSRRPPGAAPLPAVGEASSLEAEATFAADLAANEAAADDAAASKKKGKK